MVKKMNNKNIIFIVLDTLRKDRSHILENILKKYGFVSYENVISTSSWTVPSHASMFTGLYPAFHDAHETRERKPPDVRLRKREDFLPSILKKKGYTTLLFSANPQVSPLTGFSDFDVIKEVKKPHFSILSEDEKRYLTDLRWREDLNSKLCSAKFLLKNRKYKILIKSSLDYTIKDIHSFFLYLLYRWPVEKGSKKLNHQIYNHLKTNKNNYFLFVNFIEVHEPYMVFEKLSFVDNFRKNGPNPKYIRKWNAIYGKEVNLLNKRVTELLNLIRKKGMFENSLIIITSDHGQLLGENGRIGHGTFLDDELLKVPLFIRYPYEVSLFDTSYKNAWISIKDIYKLIIKYSEGKLTSDSCLFSSHAFAESYGVVKQKTGSENLVGEKIRAFERYKIAIYLNNMKGIFDVPAWKFDAITSYDGKPISNEDVSTLKNEILRFIDLSTKRKIIKI